MNTLMQDFRYALRQLGRAPGFAATSVFILALGIGVNAAMFTVVNSVLLQPLRYRDADRIVQFNTHEARSGAPFARVTGGDYLDVRAQASSFEKVAYYDGGGGEAGVQLGDHAVFTTVQQVSADFPQVFGIVPLAGRIFDDGSVAHTALVTAPFARDNYGGAQQAIGRTFNVEGKPYEIVGVVPTVAAYPAKTSVWIGMGPTPDSLERTAYNYRAVGKLKPGVSLSTAQAELSAISAQLATAYPASNQTKTLVAKPLQEQIVGRVRPVLLLLLASVAVVLLIVCVNVALLQLARATQQTRQTAVRTALGATRARIVQQIAVQGVVLATLGCAVGVVLAIPAVRLLVRMAPQDLPRVADIHLDLLVVAVSYGASLLTILLASIAPAWHTSRVDPAEAIKQDTARGLAGRHSTAVRNLLVVAEIALTFTLTVGAALLVHTLIQLSTTDLGYATSNVLVVYAHAPAADVDQAILKTRTLETGVAQIAAIPGVERVSAVMGLPTGQSGSNGGYMVVGKGDPNDHTNLPEADFGLTGPGYFKTLDIPLKRGRDFNAQDQYTSPFVAIISESLAKQSFAGEDPIGKQILCGLDSPNPMTIIGVVGDVRQDSPAALPGATLYMPLTQHPSHANEVEIVARTHVPPASLIDPVRAKLQSLDPSIATKFTTLEQSVGESIATQRFRTTLLFGFALLALTLAALGVYGVMAYAVAQRRIDIGIRIALGADKRNVVGMILSGALSLALAGIAAGLVLSVLLLHVTKSLLAGVVTSDLASYAIATIVLLSVAALAAYLPARRAASIDPVQALRSE